MPRLAIPAQGFIRTLRHVGSAHDDWHSGGADSVGNTVSLGYHSGHRADTNEPDLLLPYEAHKLLLIHWLRVAVNQQHFMARRSQRL